MPVTQGFPATALCEASHKADSMRSQLARRVPLVAVTTDHQIVALAKVGERGQLAVQPGAADRIMRVIKGLSPVTLGKCAKMAATHELQTRHAPAASVAHCPCRRLRHDRHDTGT
jgi:hypothetical protein